MVRARGSLLVSLLLCSSLVWAAEPPCTQAYHKANTEFFKLLPQLLDQQRNSEGITWVGAGAGAACAVIFRSWSGLAVCGALGAFVALPAAVNAQLTKEQIEKIRSVPQLEQYALLYQVYFAHRQGMREDVSPDIKEFLTRLNVPENRKGEAMLAFVHLLESGALCEGGDKPVATLESAVNMVRSQL